MKIICIGEDYMSINKGDDILNRPIADIPIFLKPDSAILAEAKNNIYIPDFTKELICDVHLVLKISKQGKNIATKFANRYYQQLTIGLDLTANDLLKKLISLRQPWELAKGFDKSAVVGKFDDKEKFDLPKNEFSLTLNNKTIRCVAVSQIIQNVDSIISYISQFYTLKTGDLIFTGSLSGPIKLNIGDKLNVSIDELQVLEVQIL